MGWQRFRVRTKGQDAIEVQTAAMDWASVTIEPGSPKALDMTFQVVHNALRRVGAPVPRDYRGFLEVLEDMPEAMDDAEGADLDPTDGTLSEGSP